MTNRVQRELDRMILGDDLPSDTVEDLLNQVSGINSFESDIATGNSPMAAMWVTINLMQSALDNRTDEGKHYSVILDVEQTQMLGSLLHTVGQILFCDRKYKRAKLFRSVFRHMAFNMTGLGKTQCVINGNVEDLSTHIRSLTIMVNELQKAFDAFVD